jgi:hypothetical protein
LSGDAFSQTSHRLGVNAQYSMTERTFVGIGLFVRQGDIVSTTEEGSKIFNAARALAEDPAFGPESYAYKLTGTTAGVRLGIDFTATRHSAVGCGLQRMETHADGGLRYTKSIIEAAWVYRY